MDERQTRVLEIATRTDGVITRRQALAAGMTPGMIRRRLGSGWWRTIKPGVYFIGLREQRDVELRAAVGYLPAVVSHETAARWHGFVGVPGDRKVVTVPHRRTNRFLDVVVHESTDLEPHHIGLVRGVPTTVPARTIVDLAAVYSAVHVKHILERAVVEDRVAGDDVADVFNDIARRGKPGVQKMRRVFSDLGIDDRPPDSPLELLLLDLIRDAGLPHPVIQHPLPWRAASAGRVDMAYPENRLIIEADGKRWHARHRDFEVDRRRDNLALLAGWRVLRFSWTDVTQDPAFVVDSIRATLDRGVPDVVSTPNSRL